MKKVIDFLEKNVQWVALGIGGLILLVMLAQNLPGLAQPVKVSLPQINRDVGPGEIDAVIESDVAIPLDRKMKEEVLIRTFWVPPYTETFLAGLSPSTTLAQLPDWLFKRNLAMIKEDFGPTGPSGIIDVAELPKLPPVAMGQTHAVQTHIEEVVAPLIVAPPVGPDGAPLPPAPLPALPAPDAPPAAGVIPPAPTETIISPARDATVVRVEFKLLMADIHRAFQRAGVPGTVQNTMVLKVELIRERSLPGGGWGEQTIIGPLEINKPKSAFPAEPLKPTNKEAIAEYLDWARANQVKILQPDFPSFEGDDPLAIVVDDSGAEEFDPNNFDATSFKGDVNKLPRDLRMRVLEVRRQKAKEAAERRHNEAGGQSPTPSPQTKAASAPEFESSMDSSETMQSRSMILLQPVQPAESETPSEDSEANPEAMPNPIANRITATPPPEAPFKPADNKDIDCWAFDDTAQPGETYRYRVKYYMLNPLFSTTNVAKNPDDQKVVWITNEDEMDNWSHAVTTPPLTHVFLAQAPANNFASARFVIFHWQDGKQHKFTSMFKPGDTIAGSQNGINFVSDWTLADIRASAGMDSKNLVTLVKPDGTIEVRDFDADKSDPLFQKLEAEVQAVQNATQPASVEPSASSR